MSTQFFTDQFAEDIFKTKYQGTSADIYDFFRRISDLVSDSDPYLSTRYYDLMINKKFCPGGRILAFGGRPDSRVSLMNCTTHEVVGDTLEDISDTVYMIMRASSRGQGIGIDLSKLRPMDSPVNNAAKTSTGSISFMEMFNAVGSTIGQEGRRAALLFSLADNHPDIWREDKSEMCQSCMGDGCLKCDGKGYISYDFLHIKKTPGKVENANISVRISDAFMNAVENSLDWELFFEGSSGGEVFRVSRKVPATELFMKLATSACNSAEPGVLFWDTSKRMSNSDLFGFPITGVNACSEQVLDQDGVCNLGSMNLAAYVKDPFTMAARFDLPSFANDVATAIRFLDQVIDVEYREGRSISGEQKRSLEYLRRVGLGVMGFADMLAMLGLPYSQDANTVALVETVFATLRNVAYRTSIQLAREKGPAQVWNLRDTFEKSYGERWWTKSFFGTLPMEIKDDIHQYGTRNITLLSIAPTGTISNLFGVTSGIEPLFAHSYTRRTLMNGREEFIEYVHPGVQKAKAEGVENPHLLWETAYEISPDEHVEMQALVQKYIDQSISKTLNFPYGSTPEDVAEAYLKAWKRGLKGLAVYVDGSRSVQTLYKKEEESNDDKCPVCGAELAHLDGCISCVSCSYSMCSL